MKKNIIIISSLLTFLFGCKSNYGLSAIYKTNCKKNSIQNEYIFNFHNNEYREYFKAATCGVLYGKGHFKVLKMSDRKFLIVCNDIIFEKENPDEKIDSTKTDSDYFFSKLIKNNTVFELTLNKNDSLNFRRTTANHLDKTTAQGYFTLINTSGSDISLGYPEN